MTILLKGERFAHVKTGTNSDSILLAFDLPAESVLRNITCRIAAIGVQTAIEREISVGYAVAAYMIGLDDPDATPSYQDLWDRFVPKYTDSDIMDLDTGTAVVTPFWEPGEVNYDAVFDMGEMPLRLFMRRKLLNFSDPGSSGFRFQPSESPFEPQWMPSDSFNIQINRPIRISKPSVVIIAMANPALDDTTTSRAHLTESEWGQIQYVESTLERALLDQLGVIEAGAETPWIEASDLLRKHLAPDVFEETAGAYGTESFNVFCQLQFAHTVPGQMNFRTVDLTP